MIKYGVRGDDNCKRRQFFAFSNERLTIRTYISSLHFSYKHSPFSFIPTIKYANAFTQIPTRIYLSSILTKISYNSGFYSKINYAVENHRLKASNPYSYTRFLFPLFLFSSKRAQDICAAVNPPLVFLRVKVCSSKGVTLLLVSGLMLHTCSQSPIFFFFFVGVSLPQKACVGFVPRMCI